MLEVECDLPEIYLQPGSVPGSQTGDYPDDSRLLRRASRSGVHGSAPGRLPRPAAQVPEGSPPMSLALHRATATWISRFVTSPGSSTSSARFARRCKSSCLVARMYSLSAHGPSRPTVGRQNCEAAIEVLRDEGLM